jgi:hypothetical protein
MKTKRVLPPLLPHHARVYLAPAASQTKERIMKRISMLRSTYTVVFCLAVALSALSLVAPLQGCAALNPRELTRSRALALIRGHDMFRKPAVLPLTGADKFPVPAKSAIEPEPDERALELFFEDRPVMDVLHHLGLVEATAAAVEKPQVLAYTGYLTNWKFKITPRLTAEGKKAVRQWGGEGEDSVPAFTREVIEITGIRNEGRTGPRSSSRGRPCLRRRARRSTPPARPSSRCRPSFSKRSPK